MLACLPPITNAQPVTREQARRAAIHPVSAPDEMQSWLARVPVTRDFPPEFATSLSAQSGLFIVEMTSTPGCVPCADLWARLGRFRTRYGWRVAILSRDEALLRSGRLGLPWVGHPVAWVRPVNDPNRVIPIAVGTDHDANLARNAWLAGKMLTGVRPAVGLRAMSKFTGIVGATRAPVPVNRRGS